MEAAYAEHADSMLRLAYCLSGTRSDAEDLVQDTFVKVFSRVRGLDSKEDLRAYLHRAIVNAARSRWRRKRLDARRPPEVPPSEEPFREVDERDAVWRQIRRLPTRQRAVVYLRYYEHLSEVEIADRLECSVEAVRSMAYRAVNALRREMEDQT